MATNRDLLKEAIADAKAVKETAIANAKAALEEAFTPFLKEKLSAKLQEMDDEDESMYEAEEMDEVNMEDEGMEMDEVSLDELLAELDAEEEDENLYEAKEEGEEEETEEEMNIEDMSEDDLKHFIEDVIKDMVSAGELEAGHEDEEGEEEMEMGGEEEGEDEEIELDELLAELEETSYKKKATDSTPKSKNAIFSNGDDEYVTDETEEDDSPYSKGEATKTSFYEEEMEEAEMSPAMGASANAGLTVLAKKLDKSIDWVKKNFSAEEIKKFMAAMGTAAGGAAGVVGTRESQELRENIKTLKYELDEINLLNAKLLYTNKIFRNKSLTESQKVKVLTAFDKATSKKEAQLIYETLTESLKVSTKAPIKESLSSASRILGGPTSKPIIENDAFARMRELAFGGNK